MSILDYGPSILDSPRLTLNSIKENMEHQERELYSKSFGSYSGKENGRIGCIVF